VQFPTAPPFSVSKQELLSLAQQHDRLVNPATSEAGKKIGSCSADFEVLEQLGKGAHGVVLKVKS